MASFDYMVLEQLTEQLRCSVYWKDNEGVYRGQNSYADQILDTYGFESNVIGKVDYDLFTDKVAKTYSAHDQDVRQEKKPKMFFETQVTDGGQKIMQFSIKKPLLDQQNQVHGVMGMTYHISQLHTEGPRFLTKRELDCLACLYCGCTMKFTAKKLGIAPKTVETHIDSIKNKLGCNTKAEIISVINANGMGIGYEHYFHYLINEG